MFKPQLTLRDAVADIKDGSTVYIGGFGGAGVPIELIHALFDQGARDLTVVNNNAGNGAVGIAALILNGRVRKMICSFPRSSDASAFEGAYRAGKIELETVPQGTLAERIRAAGAGIPGFYTRTAYGTPLADGKETKDIDGRTYILEHAIKADVALIKAHRTDPYGNLVYNKSARNFAPIMCMGAEVTIVQAEKIVELGTIDPEHIVTPGIFVDRLVEVMDPQQEELLVRQGVSYP